MVSYSWSLSDSYFINDATYRVHSKLHTSVNRVSVFLRRYFGIGNEQSVLGDVRGQRKKSTKFYLCTQYVGTAGVILRSCAS